MAPQTPTTQPAAGPEPGRDRQAGESTAEANVYTSGAHTRRTAEGETGPGGPGTHTTTHMHAPMAMAHATQEGGNGPESSEDEADAWWAEPGRAKRPVTAWPEIVGAPTREGGRVRRQVADIESRIQADKEAAGLGQAPGGHARTATTGESGMGATKPRASTHAGAEGGASREGGQGATGAESPTEGSGHTPDSSQGGGERAEGRGEETLLPGVSREGEDQATTDGSIGDTDHTPGEGRDGETGKAAENLAEAMEGANKALVSSTGGDAHTTDTLDRCESLIHNGTITDEDLRGSNPTPTGRLGGVDHTSTGGAGGTGLETGGGAQDHGEEPAWSFRLILFYVSRIDGCTPPAVPMDSFHRHC